MSETTPNSNGFGADFLRVKPSLPSNIEAADNHIHQNLFPRHIASEVWQPKKTDFTQTLNAVENLISKEWAQVLAIPLDHHSERYAEISKNIRKVAPNLRLVWWRTLKKLGRTPRSDEGYSLTLEEAASICHATGKIFTYYFLSHRWESRDHPDPTGRKSKICSRYGAERTQTFNEEVFFWIDFPCMDQDGDVGQFVAALPLYCSGAQVLMVPFNEEYEERGWCLVERLAYAALNVPLQFICGNDYVEYAKKAGWKQQQSCFTFHIDQPSGLHYSWLRPLANPAVGKLTFEKDRPLIKNLTEVLLRQWGKSWVQGSTWPPPGSLDMCCTTGQRNPVAWGNTTVNVILISFL